jgi:hypothetical protein
VLKPYDGRPADCSTSLVFCSHQEGVNVRNKHEKRIASGRNLSLCVTPPCCSCFGSSYEGDIPSLFNFSQHDGCPAHHPRRKTTPFRLLRPICRRQYTGTRFIYFAMCCSISCWRLYDHTSKHKFSFSHILCSKAHRCGSQR